MPFDTSQRPSRRLAWRVAGIWMVVFALGLALVGIVLQYHQSEDIHIKLVNQTRTRAAGIADTALKNFNRELEDAMRATAEFRRMAYPDEAVTPERWPAWLDWVCEWDGATWTDVLRPEKANEQLAAYIQDQTRERSLLPQNTKSPNPDVAYGEFAEKPLVLAFYRTRNVAGDPTMLVGRVHLEKLRTNLIEPLIGPGQGLILVDAPNQLTEQQALYGPAKYWALDPTLYFKQQRSNVILQLVANAVLTLIALGTLLVTLWYVLRLARHEVALAELKSDFAANVSHELKTPLAVIRMYSETLHAGRVPSESKKQEYYSIIGRESTRLTNMINNILDFARIEAGRAEYVLEPTDVSEVVRDTYQTYRAHLDHNGFEHKLIIQDGLPRINADRDAITQVLLNLIGNAVKYCDEERSLVIELTEDMRRNRRGVLISVHDRGIGVRPADQPHLFDGFFRAQDGRVRKVGGAGLGLALVKHIVDAHQGSVSVESRLVKGTTFRVFLPASEKETVVDDATREADRPKRQVGAADDEGTAASNRDSMSGGAARSDA